MRIGNGLCLLILAFVLASCGGGGGGGGSSGPSNSPNPPSGSSPLKVGGSVTGLQGSGLTLQIGQGETLAVQSGGPFMFPTALASGTRYEVKVLQQPTRPAQVCTVFDGNGALASQDVTNVLVDCFTTPLSVAVTITGLRGFGLALKFRAAANGEPLQDAGTSSPTSSMSHVLFTTVKDQMQYEVSITGQPSGPAQACAVTNGSGTVDGKDAEVSVTCTTSKFTVGGTIEGLRGQGLVLQNNNGDDLAIAANGRFTFQTPIEDGSDFTIKVANQPSNFTQTCQVLGGKSQLFGANRADTLIRCSTTQVFGTSSADQGIAAKSDGPQNTYIAGQTKGDFGGTNAGGWDGFLMKLDPGGELLWKRQFGSTGDELVHSIEFDPNGDVYVVGSTTGSLDGHSNAGSADIFLARYDHDGNKLATLQFGSAGADVAEGFKISNAGARFLIGHTTGSLDGVTTPAGSDVFVANLDASGAPAWLRQLGSAGEDAAYGVDIDALGHAYVVGSTTGNLVGHTNASGGEAGFLLEYDSLGNLVDSTLGCQLNCPGAGGVHFQSRFNSVRYVIGAGILVAGWGLSDGPGQYEHKAAIHGLYSSGAFGVYGSMSVLGTDVVVNQIGSGRSDGLLYLVGSVAGPTIPDNGRAFIMQVLAHNRDMRYLKFTEAPDDEFGSAMVSDLASNAWLVGTSTGNIDGAIGLGGDDIFVTGYDINGGKL